MIDREPPVTEEELHAYVDGELAADRREAVEQWLATHADDAARIAAWRAQADAIRARYGAVVSEPVPSRFDVAVLARAGRKWPRLAAAAALLAFLVGSGAGYSSWVHLDDAASATVLAVEQQARGVYNIVDDDPAPAGEWLPYLAACAGAKPPVRIPTWLARLLAGEVAVAMMTEGRGFSNAKAKRELGWGLRYPSWRQGFKEELA